MTRTSVKLSTSNSTTDSIAFGKDSSNNYGYIIPGADTVIPFNNIKTGPCAYILTIASTAQKTVSFTVLAAGTVYYQYFGESGYGAYTLITKNGATAKAGTQGSTITDSQSGNFDVFKNDVISATGYVYSNNYLHSYFLVMYCIYS